MRISDWSSDVCSSDLSGKRRGHSSCTLPCETGDRRRAVMSDSREIDVPGEPIYPDGPVHKDDPKVRQCLRCQSDFTSQWAGERICARCKGNSARSEEHTSELQTLMRISYAVFGLNK